MTSRRRLALALSWRSLVLPAGSLIGQQLELSGDQRKFICAHDIDVLAANPMPRPRPTRLR